MRKALRNTPGNGSAADSDQLLLDVATYYYEQRQTQEEIAQRVGTSRSTISRMLDEARERGIVHIRINYPWQRKVALEQKLVERFGLREARVLVGRERPEEEIRKGMGELAARLIDGYLKDGQILGVSYGRSIASAVSALNVNRKLSLTVVPILGAIGSDNPAIDGPDLVRRFAKAYGGEYRHLPVPLLVEDVSTRDALMQLNKVQETLNLARRADVVLLGIGSLTTEAASGIWNGYLEDQQLQELHRQGAAGYMCGQFYDAQGKLLEIDLNHRSIGIGVLALREIDAVITLASGPGKIEAILGALRGRFTNMLVTDDASAMAILALDGSPE